MMSGLINYLIVSNSCKYTVYVCMRFLEGGQFLGGFSDIAFLQNYQIFSENLRGG